VSNLEKDPSEVELEDPSTSSGPGSTGSGTRLVGPGTGSVPEPVEGQIEILEPRDVPLGGPRAMSVRRTLPQRSRSLIGAWCFVDHYGPDPVSSSGGMIVPPHPHTGLQTVSWLFAGEIEHRDSLGSHAIVRPGELNLMTAGRGIQHSEVSMPDTTVMHGAQLWIALPDATRNSEPFFERFVPGPFEYSGATVSVFLGGLLGHRSTARTFSRVIGAQLDVPANTSIQLPVDATFEHGLLVDDGIATVNGMAATRAQLAFIPPGETTITIAAGAAPLRALLIGGEPLGEQIIMWWNFIGRSHDEIVAFRSRWQNDVIDDHDEDSQFGRVRGYEGDALPAPALPNVRLRPRT
jgi:redox-sensitive bicupin YhaK (pirin superfamily)